jgi:hypothetical protein
MEKYIKERCGFNIAGSWGSNLVDVGGFPFAVALLKDPCSPEERFKTT